MARPPAAVARGAAALALVAARHPVVVEGRAAGDAREPAAVAARVAANLRAHLAARGDGGAPLVFVSQGDPPAERGVTPVLRLLAEEMGAPRVVVTLPAEIDPEHAPNADREGAAAEIDYEDLAALLRAGDRDDGGDDEGHAGADAPRPATLERLEEAVGALIATKNAARAAEGKPPLKGYYYDYALLQEVTKGGLSRLCGALTLAHTGTSGPYTVTSFCEAGLALGLYAQGDVVPFGDEDGS